jgi:hypothetical protein
MATIRINKRLPGKPHENVFAIVQTATLTALWRDDGYRLTVLANR